MDTRDRLRFFGQVGHQTTNASGGIFFSHYIMSSSDLPKLSPELQKNQQFNKNNW